MTGPHDPVARHVLVVGGSPCVQLAWCRLLGGRGLRVSLLRWEQRRSVADASRHCHRSHWLGAVDDGVDAWRQRFTDLLRGGTVTDVMPADALALALLCDEAVAMPDRVALVGPSTPAVWARGADRLSVFEAASAAGWTVLPWQHVTHAGTPGGPGGPLVVRPRWDVRLRDDEPTRFSTRRVSDETALDAKLRDDVPRGEVLVQAPPRAPTARLCLVLQHGRLLESWFWPAAGAAGEPGAWQAAAQALAAELGWTGLLELEVLFTADGALLVDVHPGGHDGFATLVRGGAAAEHPSAPGAHLMTLVAGVRPGVSGGVDILPALASAGLALRAFGAKVSVRARIALAALTGDGRAPPRLSPAQSVLIVCKGNINRSVVAEQLLRAAGYGRTASAALLGLSGRRPSRPAETYLAERLGIRPGSLQSRSLRMATDRSGPFDVVLCFERRHLVELSARRPELRGRIHLVSALAPWLGGPIDIADPHGGSDDAYRACFARIEAILAAATAPVVEPSAPRAAH